MDSDVLAPTVRDELVEAASTFTKARRATERAITSSMADPDIITDCVNFEDEARARFHAALAAAGFDTRDGSDEEWLATAAFVTDDDAMAAINGGHPEKFVEVVRPGE